MRGSVAAMTTATAVVAVASAEALIIEESEQTPLVTSVDSLVAEMALQPAEELTPSEEIVVINLSSVPPPIAPAPAIEEDELEVVIDDDLASEAALIEEALTAPDEDEEPISSRRPRSMHSLEAAMAPMELDPISDRPTARITLPPESGPQPCIVAPAPAPLPTFDAPSEVAELEDVSELEPEITISSEPADIAWAEEPTEEQIGGLIELGPADELDLELAPADEAAAELEVAEARADAEAAPSDSGEQPILALAEPPALELAREADEPIERAPSQMVASEETTEAPLSLASSIPPPEERTSEVRVVAEPPPLPLPEAPAAAEPAKVAIEIAADVVRRPTQETAEVASFVGQAGSFAPKSFGELLDASLEL